MNETQQQVEQVVATHEPIVYDRFDNQVSADDAPEVTVEQVMAELAGVELPDDEDDRVIAIAEAIDAIAQREQSKADRVEQDREVDAFQATEAALKVLRDEVEGALGIRLRRSSSVGSFYGDFRGITVRVSDHEQVAGGGFNAGTGERMGEVDVSLVIVDDHTRESIRAAAAQALHGQR